MEYVEIVSRRTESSQTFRLLRDTYKGGDQRPGLLFLREVSFEFDIAGGIDFTRTRHHTSPSTHKMLAKFALIGVVATLARAQPLESREVGNSYDDPILWSCGQPLPEKEGVKAFYYYVDRETLPDSAKPLSATAACLRS